MGWSEWPAWVKGGVIGGIIGIILSVIGGICVTFTDEFGRIICLPFFPAFLITEDYIFVVNIFLSMLFCAIFAYIIDFNENKNTMKENIIDTNGSYFNGIVFSLIIFAISIISTQLFPSFTDYSPYLPLSVIISIIVLFLSFLLVKEKKTRIGIYLFNFIWIIIWITVRILKVVLD